MSAGMGGPERYEVIATEKLKLLLVRWFQKVGVESSLIYLFRNRCGVSSHCSRPCSYHRINCINQGARAAVRTALICDLHENMDMAVSNDIKGAKAAVNQQSLCVIRVTITSTESPLYFWLCKDRHRRR